MKNNNLNKADTIKFVEFRSRNKDNKDVPNFKQRSKTLLINPDLPHYEMEYEITKSFFTFAAEGVPGEMTRLYEALNDRDSDKIRMKLISELALDKPDITKIQHKVNSIALKPECASTAHWLIDFDETNINVLKNFVELINRINLQNTMNKESFLVTEIQLTPHGFAIVCDHGFDTRLLDTTFGKDGLNIDYTLMRDNLIFRDIISAGEAKTQCHSKSYYAFYPNESGDFDWDAIRRDRDSLDGSLENEEEHIR